MNLHTGLNRYIAAKNAAGVAFDGGTGVLRAFERRVGNIQLCEIREIDISAFLDDSRISLVTWRNKYFCLFRFFQFCYARRCMPSIRMPVNRVYRPTVYAPHIYSRLELKKVLSSIPDLQAGLKIEGKTLQTMILFIYATGATPSEALNLKQGDFDVRRKRVSIFTKKLGRARELPLGQDLTSILREYCRSREQGRDKAFFQTRFGARITSETLHRNFRVVLRTAGVTCPGGNKQQPRLLDLRHTFAVHRITAFVKQKADLNRLIPSLSVYLGFVSLSTAERYFRFAPERFKKQLDLLLPTRRHPKWRNDTSLMRFLDGL